MIVNGRKEQTIKFRELMRLVNDESRGVTVKAGEETVIDNSRVESISWKKMEQYGDCAVQDVFINYGDVTVTIAGTDF